MVNRKRGGSCKVAAEISPQFHSDLLSEILLRLPAKSLVNLKRVSRQWYDVISSTQFCVEHTRRNPNPRPTGIFLIRCPIPRAVRYLRFRKDYSVQSHTMDSFKFPKGINLIDSSNGLLLLLYNSPGPCKQDSWKWDRDSNLYVCNPTTKKVSKIPQLFEIRDGWFPQLIMCFDPSTPEKYRVVCVWNCSDQCYVIDVYESETGSWRHSATASAVRCILAAGGVFWNGAVHWVDRTGYALYCFDLNHGCFRTSMLLLELCGSEHQFDIKACGGHLYVLKVDNTCPFTKKVYEIDHDFSCFSMKYSIVGFDSYSLRVLGIFLEEEEEEEGDQPFIVTCDGLQVYTHNANLSSRTDLSRSHHRNYWDFYDCLYTESLALV